MSSSLQPWLPGTPTGSTAVATDIKPCGCISSTKEMGLQGSGLRERLEVTVSPQGGACWPRQRKDCSECEHACTHVCKKLKSIGCVSLWGNHILYPLWLAWLPTGDSGGLGQGLCELGEVTESDKDGV